MVELNEIKQYINSRLGKVTTINGLDFTLSNALEINGQFCIVFTVDNDSLVFEVAKSIDDGLVIVFNTKIKELVSFIKVNSKGSFINTLYRLLDRYTKYKDNIRDNKIEYDIFNWH